MWGDSPPDECQGQVVQRPLSLSQRFWLLSSKASMRTLTWKFSALVFRFLYFQSKEGCLVNASFPLCSCQYSQCCCSWDRGIYILKEDLVWDKDGISYDVVT